MYRHINWTVLQSLLLYTCLQLKQNALSKGQNDIGNFLHSIYQSVGGRYSSSGGKTDQNLINKKRRWIFTVAHIYKYT